MEETVRLKIENHSVSGKDYRAKGVHVYVPGSAFGDKSLIVDIPASAVDGLIKYLKDAPAIKAAIIGPEPEPKETTLDPGPESEEPEETKDGDPEGASEDDSKEPEAKTPQGKKSQKKRGGKKK